MQIADDFLRELDNRGAIGLGCAGEAVEWRASGGGGSCHEATEKKMHGGAEVGLGDQCADRETIEMEYMTTGAVAGDRAGGMGMRTRVGEVGEGLLMDRKTEGEAAGWYMRGLSSLEDGMVVGKVEVEVEIGGTEQGHRRWQQLLLREVWSCCRHC